MIVFGIGNIVLLLEGFLLLEILFAIGDCFHFWRLFSLLEVVSAIGDSFRYCRLFAIGGSFRYWEILFAIVDRFRY